MMFHRLGLINKNQLGFTLLELLVVIAISGIITGGITTTIFQGVIGSARSNNHMIAVRQAQNAGYWVSHNAQMAQSIRDDPPTGEFLILTWTDWDSKEHVVTYTLENMIAGELKQLKQSHSVTGKPTETSIIAQFIKSIEVSPKPYTGGALTFTVTVSVGAGSQQQSETRVYEIVPRPG